MAVICMNYTTIDPVTIATGQQQELNNTGEATMMNENNHEVNNKKRRRCPSDDLLDQQSAEEQHPVLKKPKKQRRRVSFGHEHIHEISRISEIDAPQVYMSTSDYQYSRMCDGHWINFYGTLACDGGNYRQELLQVVGVACGKITQPTQPIALALANSDCRGLEREMTPCFKQRTRQIISNVLQSQSALVAYKAKNTCCDKANKGEEILAEHYRKLALPATRFARLLAQGDAALQVVASQQEEEEQKSS